MYDPDTQAGVCPVSLFVHYLNNLVVLLDKVDRLQPGSDNGPSLLEERLAADMFPLGQQLDTAVDFSLRAVCPLAGLEVPRLASPSGVLAEVRSRALETIGFLQSIPPEKLEGYEERRVETVAGFAHWQLKGRDFLLLYAFPNFLFHFNMAYAILRRRGMDIGKGDFDSFHRYPEGFSFL